MFVRSVSHEIRTPLNTVFLGLKYLHEEIERRKGEKDWLDILDELKCSADIAVSLLSDLLAYEKLEAGILDLDLLKIPIKKFLDESFQMFSIQV